MNIAKTIIAVGAICAATIVPGFAGPDSPTGTWQDSYGTAFKFSLCGDGALCGVLLDVQGKSRTEENLRLVNKQVMQAQPTAENEWKGTVTLNGAKASATIRQVAPDAITITGCRALVLCQTLTFNRV